MLASQQQRRQLRQWRDTRGELYVCGRVRRPHYVHTSRAHIASPSLLITMCVHVAYAAAVFLHCMLCAVMPCCFTMVRFGAVAACMPSVLDNRASMTAGRSVAQPSENELALWTCWHVLSNYAANGVRTFLWMFQSIATERARSPRRAIPRARRE